jgi:hypothetical protein
MLIAFSEAKPVDVGTHTLGVRNMYPEQVCFNRFAGKQHLQGGWARRWEGEGCEKDKKLHDSL